MKTNRKFMSINVIAVLAVGFHLTTNAQAGDRYHKVRESVEISDHRDFVSQERVDGATVLVRNFRRKDVHATISSKALEPDTAYSVWWAVFNRPQFCATPFDCKVSDLERFDGDPRIRVSVFYAGGFVSDNSGTANTSLYLTTGRTGRETFAESKNYGLQNLIGAEIHAVIRSHGPAGVAGTIAQQIGTAHEACPDTDCKNVFVSVHAPGR